MPAPARCDAELLAADDHDDVCAVELARAQAVERSHEGDVEVPPEPASLPLVARAIHDDAAGVIAAGGVRDASDPVAVVPHAGRLGPRGALAAVPVEDDHLRLRAREPRRLGL